MIFSDGINTVNLVLKNGGQRNQALRWLALDAIAPLLGVVSTLFFTLPPGVLGLVLAVFSGFFLYIGASDFVARKLSPPFDVLDDAIDDPRRGGALRGGASRGDLIEDRMEHGFRQPPGLRVIAGAMIRIDQRPAADRVFRPVRKFVSRQFSAQSLHHGVVRNLAERQDDPHVRHHRDLFGQETVGRF